MSKLTQSIAILGVVAGLGVAALPLSSYAAPADVSKDATVQLTVEDTLSLELTAGEETSGETAMPLVNLGIATPDGDIVDADLTATVKTNSKTGYTLKLEDKDESNDLVSGEDKIEAGVPAKGTSAWGYKAGEINIAGNNEITNATEYAAVPVSGSAVTIVNSDKPTLVAEDANGDTAVINFGASVSSAQAAGTYTDIVVVTAAVNPAA